MAEPSGASLFDWPLDAVTFARVDAFLSTLPRESARIQYKSTRNGEIPDSTWETVTGMSNGLGGLILVGVEEGDSGLPKPGGWPTLPRYVSRADQEDVCWSKVADLIQPRPRLQARFVAPPDTPDCGVLFVRVDTGPQPPYWHARKGILVRHGDQDRIADLATIRYLMEQAPFRSYALEQALRDGWPASPDLDAPGSVLAALPWMRVVLGPAHPMPRPTMSRALDRAAQNVFTRGHAVVWANRPPDTTSETSITFAQATSKSHPAAYEVRAWSDGITMWSLPIYPPPDELWASHSAAGTEQSTEATPDHPPSQAVGLRIEDVARIGHKALMLGLEWLRMALPAYRGPITGEFQLLHLQHIVMTPQLLSPRRISRLNTLPSWVGSFSVSEPRRYVTSSIVSCVRCSMPNWTRRCSNF